MKSKILSSNLFPVVGIGASAGGLEAFKKLIKAIPENSGMAYVLVQHLDPNHESMLPELLQKVTSIPVLEISDDIKVEPDHIYIIPSNKMMIANDGVLKLSPRPPKNKNERNLPIDLFFESLAEIHQSHAIGVILSGTGSDGTLGLKAIKDLGGITFAQDEASASYEGMPHNAVHAGVVDFILPPEQIPYKLLEVTKIINGNGAEELSLPQQNEDVFKQILTLLRLHKGTDFTYYKQTTIRRRILRRMALNKNEEPIAYLTYLRENKPEQDSLYQDLLIPVTSFFRDIKSFDNLCETVFPLIIKNKTAGEPIRVWVAGCSTGEEAYSIAVCFKEFPGNHSTGKGQRVQIFATDISEPAIAKARTGIYTNNELGGLTPQRLQKFFTRSNGNYQVNKEVRDMCVFACHNFLIDPPFGKVDFISCRNVLIYMEPYLQKKALATFHYALNPKGLLLLGKSETINSMPDLFATVDKHDKLFSRKDVPGRFMHTTSTRSEQKLHNMDASTNNDIMRTNFQKTADDIILSKYTPVGVVVNEAMDIVHFRGKTSNYLEQLPGKPSHNLLQMAKVGLAFELRNILHKAKKEKAIVIKENIPLQVNGSQRIVTIEAMPLPNIVEPHYLILFHEKDIPAIPPLTKKISQGKTKIDDKDLHIQQLEKELAESREDMRAITEDQEAVNEELQSANEELLSGSEELQSLNEELESSKEELQSTNEELTVLNQEMRGLNEQISEARNFAEAIIANIGTPLMVLDKNLRIKSANRAFYKKFQVDELETEGRLIYNIGNRQWDIEALRILLEQILPEQSKISAYEVRHTFQSIGERIMLLDVHEIRREDDSEKLILLAIEDITERTQYESKEKELLSRFHKIVLQSSVGIAIFRSVDMIVEIANEAFLQMVGKEGNAFVGKPVFESLPEARAIAEPLLKEVLKTGISYYGKEVEYMLSRFGINEKCYFNISFQLLRESDTSVPGLICVANEVTEQVIARKRMEAQAIMVQNILMTAPGFVCTLRGPDHVYELVNERYQQLFGKRQIQGKPLLVALPELEGQGFDNLLDKVYNTGETYVGIEIPITLARDENLAPELRYFNFSYQPIYDENKTIYSILVFGYEVTDQVIAKNEILGIQQKHAKDLEEKVQQRTFELNEANEELIKKNKELESFTYLSSHDLQEPLRKIQILSARILEKEYPVLTDMGKDYFNRMQNAAGRMQALLEDLLTYSHTNIAERKFENTDLNKIVEEVKSDLRETIQEKSATIEVSKLCEVSVNPSQFRQVMHNLIGNALKFSKPGTPPKITIKSSIAQGNQFQNEKSALLKGDGDLPASSLSPKNDYCHISVTDNGIGFEMQYKDQIFEVFQRLHGKEEYAGTGIGLAIVKKIIENHNGFITARGELNKGSRFDIYVPA